MPKSTVLLVYARGGPPPSEAVPKVAATAGRRVHLLLLDPLPATATDAVMPCCDSVTDLTGTRPEPRQLIDTIVELARFTAAEAVLTFSEFALLAVAEACERLGLRGPGPGALQARSKRLMRRTWEAAGLPVPRFRWVDSLADLERAWAALAPPVLLKSAWGAGSIGQVILEEAAQLPGAWEHMRGALSAARARGMSELKAREADFELIAEELIPATTESWYDRPGYGDYLSVEGMVVDGVYHPVCVTGRLPTVADFTELGNMAPCVLPEELQHEVAEVSRRAVDALGLATCGTHTELKLMADRRLCLLETAARFGGLLLTQQIEAIHGVDLVAALTRAHLGQDPGLPDGLLTGRGRCAAGSVNVLATDSRGRPWTTRPVFTPETVDWDRLLSPGSRIRVAPDFTVPSGTRLHGYRPGHGSLNLAGVLLLTAPTPEVLLRDAGAVLDGLETGLAEAAGQERSASVAHG
ncbi:ATP-grasp domain-containing protein [Streptomyces sp. NBC_01288]|uniref:ATP-grasp domain-containing protein n=1 Tax=Streptomyces sp. NBC_01288 TaxID=2903814 RepID=UPI002E161341|nr:ATP-grasp domain-containing protein [Streptomyces sp. NBC_01288]